MKIARLVFSAFVCAIYASALLAANNTPTAAAMQAFGHVPLWFEPSSGDAASPTFAAKTKAHAIAIDRAGVTFRLNPSGDPREGAAAVELRFEGANAKAALAGEEKLAGISNYFVGRDAKLWRTQVPHFGKVLLSQLYAGTDVLFYGDGQQLEYDVILKPGADASKVVFNVKGARALHVKANGDLEMDTADGTLVQALPKAYQMVAGSRTPVSTHYKLLGGSRVGFAIGKYDAEQELVIDPVLRYSTVFGGTNIDVGNGVAVDSAGHAFVVATACSQDFPVTPGAVTTPRSGLCGASVTKFDVNGSTLLYSTVIGDGATGDAIAVDSAGNAYITGETTSSTFPTTSGAFQTTCTPDTDTGLCGSAFVAKLNPTGSALVYSTYLDGSGEDHGFGIAVDSNNQAYVTGDTLSTDFPTTPSAFQTACKGAATGGCSDAFVTKVNATGTQLMYSTYLGGSSGDQGNGIAVDSTGHAYVTGGTSSTDFPITTGTPHTVAEGQAFVTKLSADGHSLVYSRYLGGSNADSGHGIAVDSSAHAVVTGETLSPDFPVRNAASPRCHDGGSGCADAFLTKLDTGGLIEWSTFVGGTSGEVGTGVAVGPDGSIYAAGHTFSADFPTTVEAFQRILGGGVDAYVVKFTSTGVLKFASFLGGGGGELHPGIAVDRSNAAYVAGLANFEQPAGTRGFPTTPGAFSEPASQLGQGDVFLSKIVSLCALRTTSPSVTICTPHASTTVHSPVEVMAGTNDSAAVKLTQVYLDGKKIYEAFLSAIDVRLPIPKGTHRLTVQAIDSGNVTFKQSINITVQ